LAEKEQRRLSKEREKMDEHPESTMPHRPSHVLGALKKQKSQETTKFSDIVQNGAPRKSGSAGAVQKKIISKTADFKVEIKGNIINNFTNKCLSWQQR